MELDQREDQDDESTQAVEAAHAEIFKRHAVEIEQVEEGRVAGPLVMM
ncbi:MAG: hypothetical protein R2851_23015 [Caldilineaceae bacterium]